MSLARAHVDFAHLNVVSSASARYGTVAPEVLVARAAELGQSVLALTDRDSVSGAVKHVRACQRAGVGPVLGCDLAVAAPEGGRVLLLARGRRGWAWLCRLITRAHEYDPPALPAQELEEAQDVVALLGPGSDVGLALAAGRPRQAEDLLQRWHARTETVLEAVEHYLPGQRSQARALLSLAERTRTMAVLTNAVRYPAQEGAEVAHVLDQARRWLPGGAPPGPATAQAHLKDGAAMLEVAQRLVQDPAAARRLIAHTNALAASCALDPDADLGMDRAHLPRFDGPSERLWRSCEEGLHRLGLDRDEQARHRLAEELGVIEHKGLSAYFLTVAEAADRIRAKGIRCSIRGSGTGSLVNHLLGISAVNPLDHGLLMERFLSMSRSGLPDVDLDVESDRRLEAYDAVFAAYPDTACVSMMETYRARSAIRDVGAAMGVPPHEVDRLAKAFPRVRARRIRSAAQDLPELRGLEGSGVSAETAHTLFRLAEDLDGLPRHMAMHPCGLVVSDSTLAERTPLLPSRAGYPMVAFDKDDVEQMGLIKLDVIGVRMQSAMATARAEIERTTGSAPDLEDLEEDRHVYGMVASSRTLGCFQVESPGQRELVSRLRPVSMADLIVDISLFRPGPVGSDMVGRYLAVRDGSAAPAPPAPILSRVLAETGGVVVFHEQVLRVLHLMTGCGLDEAEAMRRSLGSEQGRERVREVFVRWAGECGHGDAAVEEVWRVLSSFGAFGFCKAHAAAFALPTYQSAWLKRHYPAAFYAGVLTHEPGMYPRRVMVQDARSFGVPVLGVDVNRSHEQWRVERTGQGVWGVRAGLADVRDLSGAQVGRILAGRPFASLADAAARARLPPRVLDNLVRVGAFDALHGVGSQEGTPHRRELLLQVSALARGGRAGVGSGQSALALTGRAPVGAVPPMSADERTGAELAVLGYEVERHLLQGHAEVLAALAARHSLVRGRDLHLVPTGREVLVAGVKVATQTPAVRSGRRIIFTTVEDGTALVDLTFFESVQERCAATVFGSWLLVARGRVRRAGSGLATVTATHAFDLVELGSAWQQGGGGALARAVHAGPGASGAGVGGGRVRYVTGMAVWPYADLRSDPVPSRGLWHASPGSSGG